MIYNKCRCITVSIQSYIWSNVFFFLMGANTWSCSFFVDVPSRESEENESDHDHPSMNDCEFLEQDDLTQDACQNHGAGIFTKPTLRNPYMAKWPRFVGLHIPVPWGTHLGDIYGVLWRARTTSRSNNCETRRVTRIALRNRLEPMLMKIGKVSLENTILG